MTDSSNDDLAERGAAIFQTLRTTVAQATAEDEAEGMELDEGTSKADSEAPTTSMGGSPRAFDAPTASPQESGGVEAGGGHDEDVSSRPVPPSAHSGVDDPVVSRETSEIDQVSPSEGMTAPPAAIGEALPGPSPARMADPPPSDAPVILPGPDSFARDLPRVMAIANQKGGVGKTTTAVNLSACLAELGHRVLVVDLDPQGNATTGLGVNPRNLQYSMYDVLLQDRGLDDCIEPTSVKNLFVAPSSLDLAGAEIELVPVFSRELKLKRAIDAIIEDYDYVLIDCPPSLGLLTVNGLAAASEVVVPIQCEYYALEGLGQLLRNVNLVQRNLNPTLEVSGIVLVMFDGRTKLSGEVVHEVRQHFGEKVCRTVVPRTVRLSEAPSFGQPIVAFDPSSRGAIAYRSLAKELHGGTS